MQSLGIFDPLSSSALLLGLSATRIAVAFLLLPIFSNELVPALVRNAIFLALAVVALVLQPPLDASTLQAVDWMMLFAKEAFVGAAVGLLFGSLLWAFEAAGQVIDMKVGATMAQVIDPLSGHQTSLTGAFLGRLASFVFVFSGGLMLLAGTLVESYTLWPVVSLLPSLEPAGATVFEREFARLMMLTLLIAAPALMVLFVIDGVLGLINRYAQQLNVFALSLSLKAWASTAVVLVMMGTLVQLLLDDLFGRGDVVLRTLHRLFG